ncbi:MAG: hypothetical protein P8M03_03295 [Flavobacteriaceae bacterium]|nr:hypothetical protein [Flavobacteriaceae bacterium]
MSKKIFFIGFLIFHITIYSQVYKYNSIENGKNIENRILIDDSYFVQTKLEFPNKKFIMTRGGYYKKSDIGFKVLFEFNSNYKNDSITDLIIDNVNRLSNKNKVSKKSETIEGKWLMAGRIREGIEKRRDLNRSRKTMKFLIDGFFQWIAFDTEDFRFFGSGGGSYTSKNNNYIERIDFFSRDNNKVGKVLSFNYTIKGNDWYHKGFSSSGNPLHEIWSYRN